MRYLEILPLKFITYEFLFALYVLKYKSPDMVRHDNMYRATDVSKGLRLVRNLGNCIAVDTWKYPRRL